ncbi:hypothetical protein M5689_025002 [Euphorbia peplus]|nr:hypothetical protein M5689_025002 [Euphorbia peplus]
MGPRCDITCNMLWRGSANDETYFVQFYDNVVIEVEFEVSFQYLDWDPLLVSNIKKSYLQPRICLLQNVTIRQRIIRNALVFTIDEAVRGMKYDLHTQNMIDDITSQVSSFACEFIYKPSNLNVRGLTLAVKIMKTDIFDDQLP